MTSMTPRSTLPSRASAEPRDDLARSYAARVGGLHAKLERIVANQRDVAHSLNRAAAALRSLGPRQTGPRAA
ncbi:MAG: hypothetical protein C0489_07730 [Candidatus Accumulibacter sp.]|nr:hypothetical protein [Accumulibacter sp.]MBA4093965.1 hypothetical protein [Accumulibacter sp.]